MKRLYVLLLPLLAMASCSSPQTWGEAEAPLAEPKEEMLVMHGDTRIDFYYWLNDRDNPEVIAYLEAENAYSEAVMGFSNELQETLFEEIKGRIKEHDQSAP